MSRTLFGPFSCAALLAAVCAFCGCTQQQGEQRTALRPAAEEAPSINGEGEAKTQSLRPDELVQITTVAPDKVRVGETYTYEVHVKNTSSSATVRNVKVRQAIPKSFEIQSSEPEAKMDDEQATWTVAKLDPGETKTIKITAASDEEGSSQACLSVTYTPSVCLTTQFVKPEIELSKSAPKASDLCAPFEYKYRVVNRGSGAAKNVEIRDELPEGLTTQEGERVVRFTAPELQPNKEQTFTANIIAHKRGEFTSRAIAKSGDMESRSSAVGTTVRAAELEASIDGPSVEYIGRPFNYRVRVTNKGDAKAENVVVTVRHPEYLRSTVVSKPRMIAADQASESDEPTAADNTAEKTSAVGSGRESETERTAERSPSVADQTTKSEAGVVTWRVPSLAPGQSAEATLGLRGRQPGDFDITAVAAFDCGDRGEETQVTASTSTNLIALPALALAVVDTPDPVKVGEEVRYVITVKNEGSAQDEDIQVVANLPEHLEYVSSAGTTKGEAEGQKVTFEKVAKLEPGERVNWVVRAKAKSQAETGLSAELTSKMQEEKVAAEEPTRFFAGDKPQE